MYTLIIFLPLIAFFIVGFFGRYLGRIGSSIITTGSVTLSAIFSIIAFYNVAICKSTQLVSLLTWFAIYPLNIKWGFFFDTVTVTMLIVVTFISALVHLYSIEYMKNDPHLPRFMAYLSLFTFFMLMLVTGENMAIMFLGWEGVGLASYLLINFWHTRLQANKSAIKAIIVNRIGDFGLGLGMLAIFHIFHTLDFLTIFALTPSVVDAKLTFLNFEINSLDLISIFLFIGAVGKSAQLGLHTWLPDAMEGPTPVSALIHAATMVTAGIFVLVRCSPIIEYAKDALTIICIMGGLTAFFAATVGMLQNDMKRVIAYSTCSQLGYMAFACGMSAYSVSMFHLMNHAFFKALLFLGAGSVIHAMSDEQDMRRMGGLVRLLPLTYSVIFIGSLSLMGFPFLTGFYSKDLILEIASSYYTIEGRFVYWLGTISAFFTAFYSMRLLYLSFIARPNSSKIILEEVHEAPLFMAISLLILSIGSIFVGYVFKDAFVGLGTDFWNNSIYMQPHSIKTFDSEFIPANVKMIPVYFSLTGAFLSFVFYNFYPSILLNWNLTPFGIATYRFLNKRWYFDIIYNNYIVQHILKFGYKVTFKILDRGFIEYIGPYGLVNIIKTISIKMSTIQSGYIYHYAFIMVFSSVIIMFFIIYDLMNFKSGNGFIYDDFIIAALFLIFFSFSDYSLLAKRVASKK
uniref:NADH-ubiquinone oxidoreductase chain 5 n=1 Tax=Phalansterium sp. PJK-2012 TaxID=1267188 RepID=T1QDX6_9EUKA|nr:NADH dehydrogenase subunit 5 [Phalansterium sp. PJK-2012]